MEYATLSDIKVLALVISVAVMLIAPLLSNKVPDTFDTF